MGPRTVGALGGLALLLATATTTAYAAKDSKGVPPGQLNTHRTGHQGQGNGQGNGHGSHEVELPGGLEDDLDFAATPELDSLVLFGAGLLGSGGLSYLRARLRRRA